MNARPNTRQAASVWVGRAALEVGELALIRDGRREYCAFGYSRSWLAHAGGFEISPDLPLHEGHFTRRAVGENSPFPFALADTEPDAWGKRVIQRAHAKLRQRDPTLGALTRFDLLTAVDDFSRMGALRLRDAKGQFLRSDTEFRTPQFIELEKIYAATRAVEQGTETEADLRFLQGKGTSLGGLRPKCTVLDTDGTLAVGKFPSVTDTRQVVRGEVLALKLAALAKLDVAQARVETMDDTPVAIIRRFDRTAEGARIAYLSGGSLLQARRDEDRAYTELADALRRVSVRPSEDVRELWRRLVFNFLINNVDDHLWNLGVLYAGNGQWRLAPAFDVNPFPDRVRESKTWLSEDTGPITSLEQLINGSTYFGLQPSEAREEASAMAAVVANWSEIATSKEVGVTDAELEVFAPAFQQSE
ncbi:MAG TPA: type II toxin-antitoxin system HipA family toxin [Steroidobacteraceae bacterium]